MKPRIALIPGDPSGIGPELVAKLLAEPELSHDADILVIGDRHVLEMGQHQAGIENIFKTVDPFRDEWLSVDSGSFALPRRGAGCNERTILVTHAGHSRQQGDQDGARVATGRRQHASKFGTQRSSYSA